MAGPAGEPKSPAGTDYLTQCAGSTSRSARCGLAGGGTGWLAADLGAVGLFRTILDQIFGAGIAPKNQ